MQSQPAAGSTSIAYSSNVVTAARRLLAEEGFRKLWMTGMPASMLREGATQIFRLGSYPLVRDIISRGMGGDAGGEASVGAKLSAGLLGGAASGVAASPFDLARIRLQSEAGRLSADGSRLVSGLRTDLPPRPTSTAGTLAVIVREGAGYGALWRGAGVNALRAAILNAGTVPVYEHTKHLAKRHLGAADAPSLHLAAGFSAGLVGTTVAAPADMVRTRMMTAAVPSGAGVVAAVTAIWREAGLRGFLRGWWPAYLRLGPILFFYPALVEQVRTRAFGLGPIV